MSKKNKEEPRKITLSPRQIVDKDGKIKPPPTSKQVMDAVMKCAEILKEIDCKHIILGLNDKGRAHMHVMVTAPEMVALNCQMFDLMMSHNLPNGFGHLQAVSAGLTGMMANVMTHGHAPQKIKYEETKA